MSTSTITITRQVPVDPERAFAAWVDPAELARWWWPQLPDTVYELDVREGGGYRIHSDAAGIGATGTFTAVDRPSGFTMTWIWISDGTPAEIDGVPVVDTVEVRFVPNAEGTEVAVSHTSLAHADQGGYVQGWNDVMDRLPGHLGH